VTDTPAPASGKAAGKEAGKEAASDSADRIRHRILASIAAGTLQSGDRLGSERELAGEHGVSRATVRLALDELERTHVVRRVPGRGGGTFVRGVKIERDLSQVVGIPALLRQQGITGGSRIVGTGVVPAGDATAAALGIHPADLVIEIVRIRLADGTPLSYEHARFPAIRFPGLLEMPLGGSIYELVSEHFGTRPTESVERIEVELATANEAAVLDTEVGAPLLSITRTATDQDGQPFEFSHDLFRADRLRIVVHTSGATAIGTQSGGAPQRIEIQAGPG
jgi:GntR family transcriptional regulator